MQDNRENEHKEDKVSTLMQTVGKLAVTATALSPFIALTNVEAAPTMTSTPPIGQYYFPTSSDLINISPYFSLPYMHTATYEVYYQDAGSSWQMLPTTSSLYYFNNSTIPYGTKHLWGKATDQDDSVSASVYWDVELTTLKPSSITRDAFQFGENLSNVQEQNRTVSISDVFNIFPSSSVVLTDAKSEDPDIVNPVVDTVNQKVIVHGLQSGQTRVKVTAENTNTHEKRDSWVQVAVGSPFGFTPNVFPLTVAKGADLTVTDPDPLSNELYTMFVVPVGKLFGSDFASSNDHYQKKFSDVGDSGKILPTSDLAEGIYVCLFYNSGNSLVSLQMMQVVDIPGLPGTTSLNIQSVVRNLNNPGHAALDSLQIKHSLNLISPQNVPKSLIPSYYTMGN